MFYKYRTLIVLWFSNKALEKWVPSFIKKDLNFFYANNRCISNSCSYFFREGATLEIEKLK
ncbi:hypothetical protein LX87_02879 [Larkinella arboricola]|uniref:Uncharacterized protein n=1 Tax=Larkinella arboricola TaxID=643671 RepID=A0A327WXB6_LARAB|nr:hypothetical protein LX87_02879 [Larkinella arboricola]